MFKLLFLLVFIIFFGYDINIHSFVIKFLVRKHYNILLIFSLKISSLKIFYPLKNPPLFSMNTRYPLQQQLPLFALTAFAAEIHFTNCIIIQLK